MTETIAQRLARIRERRKAKHALPQNFFKFKPFSSKQKKILTWWVDGSAVKDKDGIIADGAIRSGKTLSMSLAFVLWAMATFSGQNFGMCGKTIGSFRRNVLFWLKIMVRSRGFTFQDKRADNLVVISRGSRVNYFYVFGGKDERSQDLIQGITLAGLFCDEVALMPESFVTQATGRCSVEGSKFWFNCNPQGPYHWFYTEWIQKCRDKNLIYLHFTMDDNLSLSPKIKARYLSMYAGIFYKRYILGLWVLAEGVIFDMFDAEVHTFKPAEDRRHYAEYYVSVDYGTQNPMAYGLWGFCKGTWYKIKEYHYDGRSEHIQKTDSQYYKDLVDFIGVTPIRAIIIDPSAASFIAQIREAGKYIVQQANNAVEDGIRNTATALVTGLIKISTACKHTIGEFSQYVWDEQARDRGEEKPLKINDHHMDETRYFVQTVAIKRMPGVFKLRR